MVRPCWRREAHDDDEDMDGLDQGRRELDPPPPLMRGSAPHAMTSMVGITLAQLVLLGEDVKRGARGWTRATMRDFLGDFVAPTNPSSFPIHETGHAWGRMCEGLVVVPLQVVTCGPWIWGETSPIPGAWTG